METFQLKIVVKLTFVPVVTSLEQKCLGHTVNKYPGESDVKSLHPAMQS